MDEMKQAARLVYKNEYVEEVSLFSSLFPFFSFSLSLLLLTLQVLYTMNTVKVNPVNELKEVMALFRKGHKCQQTDAWLDLVPRDGILSFALNILHRYLK